MKPTSSRITASSTLLFAATADEMYGMNDNYIRSKGYKKASERYYSFENEKIIWDYCLKVYSPYLY
jgi:hypothetical protein